MSGKNTAVSRLGQWLNRRAILASSVFGITAVSLARNAEAKNIDIVKDIILAWRKLDVEGVLRHVDDNIAWYSHVGGKPPFIGKAAMREFITALGKGITDNKWRVFNYAASGDNVYCEGVDDFKLLDGKQISVPYLGIMTVRNGLVVEWRDYFDGGIVDRMKRGEVDFKSDPIAPLTARKALF